MIKVLEYDKNIFTIKEFENKIQNILNENNDIDNISCYESHNTNSIFLHILFSKEKKYTNEIMMFGPDKMDSIMEAMNATLIFAESQNKQVKFSDVKILNRMSRVVGFLVLQKLKDSTNDTKKESSKKTRKN